MEVVFRWLFLIACFIGNSMALANNQSLVYQGRIVRPSGELINSGNVLFNLSIYSPSATHCLLYSETQSVNMTGSQGMFSLSLGHGTRTDSGPYSFTQIFVNGGSFSGLNCTAGSTYTPASIDERNLEVSFVDGTQTVTLNPMPITSVPFALQAHEVDGWGVNNLVKVSTLGSPTTFTTAEMANAKAMTGAACATNELLKWNGTAWVCAADITTGAATDAGYTSANKGIIGFDTDASTSGILISSGLAKLSNTGVTAGAYGAASKVPSITVNAHGRITAASETMIALPASQITQGGANTGEVLKWNGSAWAPAADATGTSPGDASYAAKGLLQGLTDASTSGLIISSGVVSVNSGVSANQIVKLDSSAKLPAVDGSQLTNISATSYSGVLPIANGGTNSSTALNNNRLMISSGGKIVEAAAMTNGQIMVGSSGAAPSVATLGVANGISVTTGAGTLTIGTNATSANTASTIVSRDASGNFAAGAVTNNSNILKGATSGTITMAVPTTVTSYTLTWPNAVGGAGTFLTTDASGNLSWGSPSGISDSSYTVKGAVQFLTDAATSGITVSSGVANVNTGTSANQIVKLDSSAKLPAVDGSALTNLDPTHLSAAVPINKGGTGQITAILGFNALSPLNTKGDLITSDGTNNIRLPAGSNGYVLTADSSQSSGIKWAPVTAGTVTSVSSSNADIAVATGTSTPVLALNSGTGANQIVKLDGSAKLPAVDGSALTNLNAGNISSGTLAVARGGTGATTFGNSAVIVSNVTGSALQSLNCTNGQVITFDVSGYAVCGTVTGSANGFGNGGNSFGVNATLGTNDAHSLAIKTNSTTRMMLDTSGNVGVGTTNPAATLDVNGSIRLDGSTSGYVGLRAPAAAGSVTYTLPGTDGSAGQVLTTDGAGGLSFANASAGNAAQIQMTVLTSGTSWSTPSGISTATKFKLTIVGGGGGGGGASGKSGTCGGGGGAGAVAIYSVSGLSPNTSYTYAIGAAGTAGANTGGNGGNGGSTTMTIGGTTVTGGGGNGGTGATTSTQPSPGGAGGAATNGTVNIAGQAGGEAWSTTGMGGSSILGAGGMFHPCSGSVTTSYPGSAGTGYGSGGSGAAANGSSNNTQTGGAGGAGVIIIEYSL